MQRLRPDDHFLLLMETDTTPMHIGSLLFLDAPAGLDVFAAIAGHLRARLPATPLLRVLCACPRQYDSAVWRTVAGYDEAAHIMRVPGCAAMDEQAVRRFVADRSMERLDLARPPFRIHIFDRLADGRAALLIKVHHALTDGVGFQTILGLLCDQPPGRNAVARARTERALPAPIWLAASALRFRRQRALRAEATERKRTAVAALKRLPSQRRPTPALKLSGPNSAARSYALLSLPLADMRAAARGLGCSLNDLFLAIAAGALRGYLLDIDDLPDTPLVANSARSYRRAEHGAFGNRIVALHPHLATDIADPLRRLRAIQDSMASEKARSAYDEAMLDQPETPYGPRDRQQKLAKRTDRGQAVLPGNVTLSNVPGPEEPRFLAGCRQLANYPMPILGSGRFLNITARRNGDQFDLGIMADAVKMTDLDRFVVLLQNAFSDYVTCSVTVQHAPTAAA